MKIVTADQWSVARMTPNASTAGLHIESGNVRNVEMWKCPRFTWLKIGLSENSVFLLLRKCFVLVAALMLSFTSIAQSSLDQYNIVWTTQSKNSSESMPCGGGDIGLNVWVENGDVYFYVSQSGAFDENNALLKMGRVKLSMQPNPFGGKDFKQELVLRDGHVKINGSNGNVKAEVVIWVDIFRPVVHAEIKSNKAIKMAAAFESWRYADRPLKGRDNNANSWKWGPQNNPHTMKDEIAFEKNSISFFHRNKDSRIFDFTVKQQGMESVKDQLYNPQQHLQFGGEMQGANMIAAGSYDGRYVETDFKGWKLKSKSASKLHSVDIFLNTAQTKDVEEWKTQLQKTIDDVKAFEKTARKQTLDWWKQYWERSFVFIKPNTTTNLDSNKQWQVGRNYQLFRYMLGCNAYGKWPTKFNGGLFTYDPVLVDTGFHSTPDFRNWGGGIHTAQNQRLVYWPMLKSGDIDMMKPQFDFYLRILRNAELRSEVYWQHKGACFTEQMENFGLPNPAEYGLRRPADFDKGVEYNAWLEYEWDTVLEFCMMMMETNTYAAKDIKEYIPLIESCLTFFNEHYQYLAKKRSARTFDANGHLVLYPGSAVETYKMANNSTSTIAALKTVLTKLLSLPANYLNEEKRKEWQLMLERIPPISFANFNGHTTIAPAKTWERINNTESPQLYPVYPWGIFGIGKPGLDTAINTYKYDTNAVKFRSHIGWKQDNIFAARLGLTEDAARLNTLKLQNSGRRFPAFWGPGYDWVPDHNWGGSGMIGVQEMLMQVDDKKIYLFPAWPKTWDVHFKLYAPYNTTVEAMMKNGKIEVLKVIPEERAKDLILMNN